MIQPDRRALLLGVGAAVLAPTHALAAPLPEPLAAALPDSWTQTQAFRDHVLRFDWSRSGELSWRCVIRRLDELLQANGLELVEAGPVEIDLIGV